MKDQTTREELLKEAQDLRRRHDSGKHEQGEETLIRRARQLERMAESSEE